MPEPIYSAEQIRIPEEFPNLLKDYCKHILRQQPVDLVGESVRYFEDLERSRHQKQRPHRPTTAQLEVLYLKLSAVSPGTPLSMVPVNLVKACCGQMDISETLVQDALRLGDWSAEVPWPSFWALLVSASTGDLLSTVETCLGILAEGKNQVRVAEAVSVIEILVEKDPTLASKQTLIRQQLQALIDSATTRAVGGKNAKMGLPLLMDEVRSILSV